MALMRDDRTMAVGAGQEDSAGADDRAEVVRRELLLLDPAVRSDLHRVRGLLHPDFLEFGASGRIWDSGTLVEALAANSVPLAHGAAVDLVPVNLSADCVLLTYHIDGQVRPALRSSVWLRNPEGTWLLRFHQGTPVPSTA
jgi:hypothetical protein